MSLDRLLQELEATDFFPGSILPDSKIHRFKRTSEDKNPDAWYWATQFNSRQGSVEFVISWNDWRDNKEPYTFCTLGTKLNGDRQFVRDEIERATKKADKELEELKKAFRIKAKEYLESLPSQLTPYMEKKGFKGLYGAKSDGLKTIIPVMNKESVFGYSIIDEEGHKKFQYLTDKKGNYFVIKGSKNTTYIVEGFATGCTIHEATGSEVIVAFDAGNVIEVKKKFQNLILAGDNDDAGHKCGTGLFPPIEGKGNNDWNDYHKQFGIEAVRELLKQQPKEYVWSLGYKDDNYAYQSNSNRQVVWLSASSHTENNYLALQPRRYWEANYPQQKNGVDWKSVTSDLMERARVKGIFNPKNIRGTGAWLDNGLIVNCGSHVYPRQPDSKYIYIVSGEIPSPEEAMDPETITDIIESLSWKHPNHGKLLIGWLAIAPFCGALEWRPHVWLTGQAGAGKSVVMDKIISPVLGEYKIYVKGNSTEAGVRQTLSHDAKAVIFDEYEQFGDRNQERNKAIMDLIRQASFESGGEIVKGSSSGSSLQYSARFCALVASIQVSLINQADKERFAVIELNDPSKHDKTAFRRVEKKFADLTPEYSRGLFSFTYNNFEKLQGYMTSAWDRLNQDHTPRFAQQYAPLISGYALFKGLEPEDVIKEFNFEEIKPDKEDSDEVMCLHHLTHSNISVETPGGIKHERAIQEMIHTLFNGTDNQADDALAKHGMKLSSDKSFLCVMNNHPMLNRVFSGTKWANQGWSKSLSRLPKSEPKHISIYGKTSRGVKVYLDNILKEEEDGPVL